MPFTIRIAHQNKSFIIDDDETILEGALRQNFDIPHSCCEGICGSCEGQVIDGIIYHENTEHLILDEKERTKGRALFCSAKANSDLLIDIPGIYRPDATNEVSYEYRLETLQLLNQNTYQALLFPTQIPLPYLAGQYVEICLPHQAPKPFSIANAPNPQNLLEFHIRYQKDNTYTQELIHRLQKKKTLMLKGPLGHCFYHPKPKMPMILLAVGTGFAPMKAILEETFRYPLNHEVSLFWAGKTSLDVYQLSITKNWEKNIPGFRCVPILSSESRNLTWPGIYGNIFDIVLEYYPNLAKHHIYFGGPSQLTLDGLERFLEHGAQTCYLYSDVFDLA